MDRGSIFECAIQIIGVHSGTLMFAFDTDVSLSSKTRRA